MKRLVTWLVLVSAMTVALLVTPRAFAAALNVVEALPIVVEGGQARFSLRNDSKIPMRIFAIQPRAGDLPAHVVATLDTIAKPIAPGETRMVAVKWDRPPTHTVLGHLVVETAFVGRESEVGTVAVPLSLRVARSPVVELLAVWLFAIPLLGAIAALVLARVQRDERLVRWLALAGSAAHVLVSLVALKLFDPSVGQADGNAGYQHVVRSARGEWWLGVDGATMPWVVTVALLGLVCVGASFPVERRLGAHLVALLAALGFATLALVALDGAVLLVALAGAIAATAVLVSDGQNGRAVVRVLLHGAIALIPLALALFALRRHGDHTWFLDGTRAPSFALPELARTDWLGRSHGGLVIFALPFVKGAFAAVVIAAIALLRIAPLHGSGEALVETPTAGAVVLTAILPILGASVLVRCGVQMLPEGARWASPALAFLAAATVVWCALCAAGERDLRAVAARLASAHAAIAVLALMAFTPQGVSAAVTHLVTSGLSTAMLLVALGLVERRLGTCETRLLGGLATESAPLGMLSAIALVTMAGAPGTGVFATAATALIGAFPVHRGATALALLGLALAAIAIASHWRRAFFGAFPETWRKSPLLEPFGGELPELDHRERAILIALAIVLVTLGVAPHALFDLTRGFVDDVQLHANPDRIG